MMNINIIICLILLYMHIYILRFFCRLTILTTIVMGWRSYDDRATMRICYEMCRTTTATTTASRIDVPSSNWRTPTHTHINTYIHTYYTIHLHTLIHTHTQTQADANVFLYWTFQIKMENANANCECECECSCWMTNWTAYRIRIRRRRRRERKEYILKRNDKEWKNKRYIDLFWIDITIYDKQKTKNSFYFVNGSKAIVDTGTGVS